LPILVAFAVAVVATIVLSAFGPKPPKQKGATLDDFEAPQIDDGTPHAVVFGDAWLEGWQVLWYGNFRTKKIKSKGGKK